MNQSSTKSEKLPYIVALTGGIASGKTLVSDEFARLGVPIVDMDVIAHEVVEPGQPALQAISDTFGPDIIDSDGCLKRSELRAIIFEDPESRLKLEAILHPVIRQQAAEAIKCLTAPYCILVIPLLSDRSVYPDVDRVLVVDVDEETQITRLMARDNSNRQQAEQALASQISREQRLNIADDVLVNSGTLDQAAREVAHLHQHYLRLAEGQEKVGSE